ncbi:NAD(P)/FAD-dependent oxidoreductase [Pedobacter panaciterrae]|uniref:NAD(P)/FAD-dependent oxidoreductase n=1 Tax=Pedobacter panaciterrae TaxID=363849 RepID=UPI0025986643|nr:NAD(P)/FAD-dependent oxidoreductase [uncultured Pedobacter sp.]
MMEDSKRFDVIIIGGSYAGLSAAMALGRSLKKVLIIDSGKPCNKQTPHSHNFITQDGLPPKQIAAAAKDQVLKYSTVTIHEDFAIGAAKAEDDFIISTQSGESFAASKLLFATGISDQMLDIKGFAECWGISVLHCPYCHGYEVKHQPMGVIANGDLGFEFSRLIYNWSKNLVLLTNGQSTLSLEQTERIKHHGIEIIEKEIVEIEHNQGYITNVVFKDGSKQKLSAVFAKVGFNQHSTLPEQLGCNINEQGFISVDDFQRTTISGIYAAGDNTTMFRAVSAATAAGTKAGAMINKELIEEAFS